MQINKKNYPDKSPNHSRSIPNNTNNGNPLINKQMQFLKLEEKLSLNLTIEQSNTILMEKEEISRLLANFENKEWKIKIEILHEITPIIINMNKIDPKISDAFLIFIKNKFKDFKESNLNLIRILFNCLQDFADAQIISKEQTLFLSPFFIERFSDGIRSADFIWNFYASLFRYQEIEGIFEPLFRYFITLEWKRMNPKQVIEFIAFLIKSIEFVSLINMPLKSIIDFSKIFLVNSGNQPPLRQKTLSLFKKIYQYLGANLFALIKDLPANLLKSLQIECSNVPLLSEAEKKSKIIKLNQNNEASSSLMEKLPKSDISIEISKNLRGLMDPDWKIQKDAIDQIERILINNPKIYVNNLGEFINCLKNGIKDKKNKNLLRNYVNLLGKFAEASGKEFANVGKQMLPFLLSSLSDKQSLVRCDVVNCIQKIEVAVGPDFILCNGLSSFICNVEAKELHNYEAKLEIFSWLIRNNESLVRFSGLKSLINAIISGLMDKNKDIRGLAEQIITNIVKSIGNDIVLEAIKDLRPIVIAQIKNFLDRLMIDNENPSKEIRSISKEKSIKKKFEFLAGKY